MGLESFSTEGPRTFTSEKTRQTGLDEEFISDFEEEWGVPLHEAETDHEFIAERLEEGYDMGELCELFSCLEHTIIGRLAEMVDEDVIEVEDIPEVTHPAYNDKSISEYIRSRIRHSPLGSSKSSSTSDSNSKSVGGMSGLDAFKS